MAEVRRLVLNDLLCFAVNKFSRIGSRPLKSVLIDFYSPDDITYAKDCLLGETESLGLEKCPKPPRRRKDSVNRIQAEIDDILNIIATVDEAGALTRLPLFVSADPDKMPSVKLTDGDLSIILLKLDKLELDVNSVHQSLTKVNEAIIHQNEPRAMSINNTVGAIRAQMEASLSHADAGRKPTVSGVGKATAYSNQVVEMPLSTHGGAGSSHCTASEMSEASDIDGPYNLVQRGRKRKKIASPALASASPYLDKLKQTSQPPANGVGRKTIIGNSTDSTLKASKTLRVKKAVYCLNNIDNCYSVNEVRDYISSIGVRILSCFELKPMTQQSSDSKAFRVCILAEDRSRLLDSNHWSVGVTLREWVRKPRKDLGEPGFSGFPSSVDDIRPSARAGLPATSESMMGQISNASAIASGSSVCMEESESAGIASGNAAV
jgi:hypothetical protein